MRDGRTARGFYLLDVLQAAPYGPSPLCRAAFLTWICEQLDQHPRHAGMARIETEIFPAHLAALSDVHSHKS